MPESFDCFCDFFHPPGHTSQALPGPPFPSPFRWKRTQQKLVCEANGSGGYLEAVALGTFSLSSTSRRENHDKHVFCCLLPLPVFKSFPVTSHMLLLLWRGVKYWYGCYKKNAFGEAVRLHLGTEDEIQHRRTCFPSGSLPVQRQSARLTFCFEIPDISNSLQAVGQGVSVCVDFKLSYFNWRGRMSVVWGFLQRFSEIKPALTVMLIAPIKHLHLSKSLS